MMQEECDSEMGLFSFVCFVGNHFRVHGEGLDEMGRVVRYLMAFFCYFSLRNAEFLDQEALFLSANSWNLEKGEQRGGIAI